MLEIRAPKRQNLRALVDALKAAFGFRDCFNGRDPEFTRARGMQGDANLLPAVFNAKQRRGQDAGESQVLGTARCFEEAVLWEQEN